MAKLSNKKQEIGLQILSLEDEHRKLKLKDQKIKETISKLRAEFGKEGEK